MAEPGRRIRATRRRGIVVGPARGVVTSNGPFRANAKLDPSQVVDMRSGQSDASKRQAFLQEVIGTLRGSARMMLGGRHRPTEGRAALRRFNDKPKRRSGPRITLRTR